MAAARTGQAAGGPASVAVVLVRVALVVCVGCVVAGWAGAWESASGVSARSSVSLFDDDGSHSLFDGSALLVPGHPQSNCLSVGAAGAQSGDSVTLAATSLVGAGLPDHLVLTVDVGTGGVYGDCSGFSGTTVWSGTLAALAAAASTDGIATGWQPASTPARSFRITVDVDSAAAVQGTTAAADLEWRLVSGPVVTPSPSPTTTTPSPTTTTPSPTTTTPSPTPTTPSPTTTTPSPTTTTPSPSPTTTTPSPSPTTTTPRPTTTRPSPTTTRPETGPTTTRPSPTTTRPETGPTTLPSSGPADGPAALAPTPADSTLADGASPTASSTDGAGMATMPRTGGPGGFGDSGAGSTATAPPGDGSGTPVRSRRPSGVDLVLGGPATVAWAAAIRVAQVAVLVGRQPQIPFLLLMLVVAFLAVQDRIDRRDPKLALAAISQREAELAFLDVFGGGGEPRPC
jgi:hypothetical protein